MHIESMYRSFVSEGLRMVTKNTAIHEEAEALSMNFDAFMEKVNAPEETRTAEEIIDSIKEKLNSL